jgi:hypothetical protein
MAAIIRARALHAIVRAQLQEGTGLHAAESTLMLHVKDVRARGSDARKMPHRRMAHHQPRQDITGTHERLLSIDAFL